MVKEQIRLLCSDISHMALVFVWRDCGATQRNGFELTTDIANIDVSGYPRVTLEERAPGLLSGRYDFLSGLHHETYRARAQGDKRFVYLAQAQNDWDDRLVAMPDIARPQDLEGRRVIVSTSAPCVYGNLRRALEHAGADVEAVDFDPWRVQGSDVCLRAINAVLEGAAAAAAVDVPFDLYGQKRGLRVIELPPMPVIHNTTICADRERVRRDEETTLAFLRSMIEAIHFFKTEPDQVCAILKRSLAPLIGISDTDEIEHLQRFWAAALSPKPFPHPLAIWNVYQLDSARGPESSVVGPMEMWDTGYLRDIDDTGFIDDLYGGVRLAASPPMVGRI
jgi:hypothetical protein